MVVDEQEFRSFIANLIIVRSFGEQKDFLLSKGDYQIAEIRLDNQLDKYKQMLETPKPSKWKQLKLIEHDKINN